MSKTFQQPLRSLACEGVSTEIMGVPTMAVPAMASDTESDDQDLL